MTYQQDNANRVVDATPVPAVRYSKLKGWHFLFGIFEVFSADGNFEASIFASKKNIAIRLILIWVGVTIIVDFQKKQV